MFTNQSTRERRYMLIVLVLMLLPAFTVLVAGQENQFSGPQPGESLTPFDVLQVLSTERVNEVEIVQLSSEGTTVLMFMHQLSEPAIGLMITIEWYAARQKDIKSHYIMLTDDVAKSTSLAKRWARNSFFSRSPMSISMDGLEGPGQYGLNRNLDMTVLIAKDNEVVHNFALRGPNNTDAPKILEAIATTVGRPAPSYEKIRDELRAERQRRRESRLRENRVFKLAPNPELGRLMVAMIQGEQVTEKDVNEIATKMKQWAGDDEKKRASLSTYADKLINGNFEINRYAREALEKLSGK